MRWLFALALALFLGGWARDSLDAWIEATDLPPLVAETGVEVRARDGRLLWAFTVEDGRWRLGTSLAAVDPGFVQMLLAYEDRRFYRHGGVDLRAMARAAVQAAWSGRVISGASTLTMQVARLLEGSGTGQLRGKLRQIRLALALERALSKDQILSLYLHLAPYGGNIEGLRAASLTWLGKEPARLTPAEAALLVALPQSPAARRPDRFPQNARAARNRVLDRAARFGVLTPEAARAARLSPVPQARHPFPGHAPHLAARLRRDMPETTVHVTHIDLALQTRLEALARRVLIGQDPNLQIAIVVANHQTGQGLAAVGSMGFAEHAQGYVDFTQAKRSPGSTLKPFVYGLAMEAGLIQAATLIEDRPARFGAYAPQNFDRQYLGTLSIGAALQSSRNVPVVAVLDRLGPARLVAALEGAGVRPAYPGVPGLALALGGMGLSLEELVQLYGGLGNGGQVRPLHFSGATPPARALMDAPSAWHIAHILAGLPPPAHAPRGRLAYKTGTSYGHRDAWAIGFDGRHVAGIWIGRADGTPVPGAFGAALAAPVLFETFARIAPNRTPLPPPPPEALLRPLADLPAHLQRFDRPPEATGPRIAFPPNGAVLELVEGLPLMPRVDAGQPPYAWLINGAPVATGQSRPSANLGTQETGFLTLTVIDAKGRAAHSAIELRKP